jgi:hypothetical protein
LLSHGRRTNKNHIKVQAPGRSGSSRDLVSIIHSPSELQARLSSLSVTDIAGGPNSNYRWHSDDESKANTRDILSFPRSRVYDDEQPHIVDDVSQSFDLEEAYDYNSTTRDSSSRLTTSISQGIEYSTCLLTYNNGHLNKAPLYGSSASTCTPSELAESSRSSSASDTTDHHHFRNTDMTMKASVVARCGRDLSFIAYAASMTPTTPEESSPPKIYNLPITEPLLRFSRETNPISGLEIGETTVNSTTPKLVKNQILAQPSIPPISSIKSTPWMAPAILVSPPLRVSSIPVPAVSRNASLRRPSAVLMPNASTIPATSRLTLLSNTKAAGSRFAKRTVGRLSRIVS